MKVIRGLRHSSRWRCSCFDTSELFQVTTTFTPAKEEYDLLKRVGKPTKKDNQLFQGRAIPHGDAKTSLEREIQEHLGLLTQTITF